MVLKLKPPQPAKTARPLPHPDWEVVGAATTLNTDARTVGPGAAPAVAALPSNGGAMVAYTNGTSLYASVEVY
ncbi:hypothetical protein D7W82_14280 [Corallococcus sp. CA049B]|nr:hypothetical protein [Corallococcus coralloides]RKG87161.1 hypothetical protein D7W82_14280 [Corallococcus sp. CA049B]